jgi:hypothetical protein
MIGLEMRLKMSVGLWNRVYDAKQAEIEPLGGFPRRPTVLEG